MIRGKAVACGLFVAGVVGSVAGLAIGQQGGVVRRGERAQLPRPIYRVAQQPAPATATAAAATGAAEQTPKAEHPLEPALRIAQRGLTNMEPIKDYSCKLYKKERIGGKLQEQECMFIKIRHEPFSVYTYFMSPESKKGQEAIYVEGQNDGNLLGHGVGIRKIAGTVSLKPTSMLAMQGQRYPITEIGILNLTRRLVEVANEDKQYGECEVKFFNNAKINGRSSTCIQVIHPVPRRNFRFHMALVFVDDELGIPVRYAAYEWPTAAGSQPPLLEEYTYVDLKINNGFTDADFDVRNPVYGFR